MPGQTQTKKGSRKVGRDLQKCAAYRSSRRREYHKAKRVFKSNGEAAYKVYCQTNGLRMSLLGA